MPLASTTTEPLPTELPTVVRSGRFEALLDRRSMVMPIVLSLVAVAVVTGAMLVFREQLGVLNVILIYIILAVAIGYLLEARAATIGAVASFVAFDICFIPPYGTLSVADPDHVLALVVFLVVAIGTSLGIGRIRDRTRAAVRENERTTLLYDLNRSLVSDVTLPQLLHTIAEGVVNIYGARACRILVIDPLDTLAVDTVWPATESRRLDRQEMAMATYAIGQRAIAGLGTTRSRIRPPHGSATGTAPKPRPLRDTLFVPIVGTGDPLGVLEVIGRPGGGRFTLEDQRLLTTFADQVALAMERARLIEEATRSAVLEQSDQVKSAMLAAVSHDLRTPLAAIKASASTLLDASVDWPEATRNELLTGIEEETDRLTLMVSNLLDLSRIEGGALHPQRDWQDVIDLAGDAIRQARRHAGHRTIVLDTPEDLPLAFVDYVQISQVLANLLGNAIKYSADDSTITVRLRATGPTLLIEVADEGVGIPPAQLPHIFESFYRVHQQGPVAGTGIGLAICDGLVTAHGGTIAAHSEVGVGTTISIRLPLSGAQS